MYDHDEFCKDPYQACTCIIAQDLRQILKRIIIEYEVNRLVAETELELIIK